MKIILHCTDNEKSWKESWFLAISDESSSLEKTPSNSGKVTPQEAEEDEVKPSLSKEAQNKIDTAMKADLAEHQLVS
ncbi:hypothetical protein L484_002132 [Morus notabilis]|uniref:Uncharacterized protein n=1 Tax=Morus notabilis TaxID=981085 RepID=W9SCB6_9ROSA|nr:hypothetical protein L484_002132 [Morus notabilis]